MSGQRVAAIGFLVFGIGMLVYSGIALVMVGATVSVESIVASTAASVAVGILLLICAWGLRQGRFIGLAIGVLSYIGLAAAFGVIYVLTTGSPYRASAVVIIAQLVMLPVYAGCIVLLIRLRRRRVMQ